ncbi:MAG: NAD(P)H-dependent oxidoreductase [Bacillota bacterium]|nr:NAD(P)H-dependent oxidoreductase [Bacillota bacterium]
MRYRIGVLVGSLRKGSFSRSVAEAMAELFPEQFDVEFLEIEQLPYFNQDFEEEGATPQSYLDFRKKVAACDGFLFATPEYNRSYPAVLKNALDVASRPYGASQWNGKPAAIVGVSPGQMGGFGASQHLRQTLSFLNLDLVQQPEAYIGNVGALLDDGGRLVNEGTRAFLQTVVDALVAKIRG